MNGGLVATCLQVAGRLQLAETLRIGPNTIHMQVAGFPGDNPLQTEVGGVIQIEALALFTQNRRDPAIRGRRYISRIFLGVRFALSESRRTEMVLLGVAHYGCP